MLKWVIWLLVLANTGYFAWSQGYLAPLGLAPQEEREPERLQAQINPDALRLLNGPRPTSPLAADSPAAPSGATQDTRPTADAAPAPEQPAEPALARTLPVPPPGPVVATLPPPPAPAVAPAPAPAQAGARSCWVAGGFTEPQTDTLRAALALLDLPRGSWQLNEGRSGGRWVVYMGPYDNDEQLERKKAELRELKVAYRSVSVPSLGPGLALGTYSSEAAGQQALRDAARAGVRNARVAQERAESTSFSLRLPDATPAQRSAVAALGPALAGKSLRPCN